MLVKKYRVTELGTSIVDGPGWDITKFFGTRESFLMTFSAPGGGKYTCKCVLDVIGYQDALGNVLPIPEKGKEDGYLLFGRITILAEGEYEAQVRAFEYYNPKKRKGELLAYGAEVFLKH